MLAGCGSSAPAVHHRVGRCVSGAGRFGCATSAPLVKVAPVITGTTLVGNSLSTNNGTWYNNPQSFAYQWQDCTAAASCSNIVGATSSSYTVQSSDIGSAVGVKVSATNSAGTGTSSVQGSVFTDEFASTSVDTTAWQVSQGANPSNGELECYMPGNVTEGSGLLSEQAAVQTESPCPDGGSGTFLADENGTTTLSNVKPFIAVVAGETVTGTNIPANDTISSFNSGTGTITLSAAATGSATGVSLTHNTLYTGGAVNMRSFNFEFGTIVVKMQTSGGTGSYPAIWMMGYQCQPVSITDLTMGGYATSWCNWPTQPGAEEIDNEEWKNSTFTSVFNNHIYNVGSGNTSDSCNPALGYNASAGSHVYELDWTSSSLVYKADGTTTCTQTTSIPSDPMFLIIQTAVGGSNVGTVTNATLPQTSTVDYVHVTSNSPVPHTPPLISGTPTHGQTLTATTGSWTGTTPTSYSYQWQDCVSGANLTPYDPLSGTCTNIAGANSASYTLGAGDVGKHVDVNVVANTTSGAAGQVSAYTALIA